jgi:manganese/zinc/iron transport system permease protein
MLIAPALSARFLTKRLSSLFWVAAIVGALSGFLGNVFSLHLPTLFSLGHVALPTGPMILLSASSFCFAALLFSPEKGLLKRICRAYRFRRNCQMDNFLKYLWKEGGRVVASTPFLSSSCHIIGSSRFSLMHRLKRKGLILIWEGSICLTEKGRQKAERIVRLHRLWELYLVQLGCSKDKVHASAEEMEHVLTPEIEAQLMRMLDNPEFDPHNQPIPKTM